MRNKKKYWIHDNLLQPVAQIKITHNELIKFNKLFKNNPYKKNTRQEILGNYLKLIKQLKRYCKDDFKTLLHGSFVSGKKEPSDLDARIFLSEYDFNHLRDLGLIATIYEIMREIKLDLSFIAFTPNDNLSKENISELDDDYVWLNSRKVNGEPKENCSGFFEIDYKIKLD